MNSNRSELLTRYLHGELQPSGQLEMLLPRLENSCDIWLSCRPEHYSASAIARAVEDCDASLLSLAVTAMRTPEGLPIVFLRADTRNS